MCDCNTKIVRIVTNSLLVKHVVTRDKVLIREGCYKR